MIINSVDDLQKYIKKILIDREISLVEISKKLNLTKAAISARLNRPNISIPALLEICEALDADLDITIVPREH